MNKPQVNVTKTFLPAFEEYAAILRRAWDTHWITNRGQLIRELEVKLRDYLGIEHIIVTNNGTIPLQIALKLLGGRGEVITTPFSYVATTAAIVWENCTPVYVDIDPGHLTIDEKQIEAAITPHTTAILATHVFGNPCHVEAIEAIAKKHRLYVIYDAAHCFGVKYKDISLFNYGDISTCSFHATKLFHTGEGGAMFCKTEELRHLLFYSHNFGHNTPYDFFGLGINAKISELQAALGLSVFPYMDSILAGREQAVKYYNEHLDFSRLQTMKLRKDTQWNYSYYPVIFETENDLLHIMEIMNKENIFPRRYFYPSLNTVPYAAGGKMPVSESISPRILCLPLYTGIEEATLSKICGLLNAR